MRGEGGRDERGEKDKERRYYKFNTKSKLKSIELTEHDERSSY